MIEPYGSAIHAVLPKVRALGLELKEDSEYSATLSGADYSLKVTTERYYYPRLGITFIDSRGKQFENFLLEQIVDPIGRADRFAKMQVMLRQYDVSSRAKDEEYQRNEIYAYAVFALEGTLEFLSAFSSKILPVTPWLDSEYAKKTQEFMDRFHKGETTFG
jgi:hypothetical protein